jgi:hypothetical protein
VIIDGGVCGTKARYTMESRWAPFEFIFHAENMILSSITLWISRNRYGSLIRTAVFRIIGIMVSLVEHKGIKTKNAKAGTVGRLQ